MRASGGLIALTLVLGCAAVSSAQQATFDNVRLHVSKSAKDRVLVEKDANLVFQGDSGRLLVRSIETALTIPYKDVRGVVFDVTHHMRGGWLGRTIGGPVGLAITAGNVTDFWLHLEYARPDGQVGRFLLEIDGARFEQVIERARAAFGDRVGVTDYPEGHDIKKNTLKDFPSQHSVKVDKKRHPLPEIRDDKALVVVVCPPVPSSGIRNQFKLHANDRVVAVNKLGTYGFCHLDPGEYTLVSQARNANGFQITLEAGKAYFFLQNAYIGGGLGANTRLTRNSPELVMYQLEGAYYSDWKVER